MNRECLKIQRFLTSGDGSCNDKVAVHLETCAECAAFEKELLQLDGLINDLPYEEAPEPLSALILDRFQEKETFLSFISRYSRPHYRPILCIFAALAFWVCYGTIAATALLIVVGAWLLFARFYEFNRTMMRRSGALVGACLGLFIIIDALNINNGMLRQSVTEVIQLKSTRRRKSVSPPARSNALSAKSSLPRALEKEDFDVAEEAFLDAGAQGSRIEGRNAFAADKLMEPEVDQAALRDDLLELAPLTEPKKKKEMVRAPINAVEQDVRSADMGMASRMRKQQAIGKIRKGNRQRNSQIVLTEDEYPFRPEGVLGLPEVYARGRKVNEALEFVDPQGYWRNTYVPGDRQFRADYEYINRLLSSGNSKFASWMRKILQHLDRTDLPLDEPYGSGMSLTLNTDTNFVDKPKRVLLQVGLKGLGRPENYRPPVNVALVVDMQGARFPQFWKRMKALISSFEENKEVSDVFSLIIKGAGEPVVIPSRDFRYGTVKVALEKQAETGEIKRTMSAHDIIRKGRDLLLGSGAGMALGRTVLVYASARSLKGEEQSRTEDLVSEMSEKGIVVSTVALKSQNMNSLTRIAQLGQGRREFLLDWQQADAYWKTELSALSQVVARALRLKIKLAPQVKLVEVIGSEKLTVGQTKAVKRIEKSIDRQMAREFGIVEDRGDDQDGIQILLPVFYAGDSHSILLDLLVPAAGQVADAELKYKDIVHARNSTIRTSTALSISSDGVDRINLAVTRNHIAHIISQAMRELSLDVQARDIQTARKRVLRLESIVRSAANIHPRLKSDTTLENDLQLVIYLKTLLNTKWAESDRQSLLRVLHIIERKKVLAMRL